MKYLISVLGLLLLFSIPSVSEAQRQGTSYESLIQRSDQPNSYITDVILPTNNGATVSALFRLDYDLIPFLRVRPGNSNAPADAQYFAPIQMGIEVFEGHVNTNRRNFPNATSVFRDSYLDTVYVSSFEQTRSRLQHVQGVLSTDLEPGEYNYELQLTRAQSTQEQSSTRRNISVPAYDTLSTAGIMLMSDFSSDKESARASGTFLNYGENVLYGSDYDAMIVLPGSDTTSGYRVEVRRLLSTGSGNEGAETVFEQELTPDQLLEGGSYTLERDREGVHVSMNLVDGGTRFGVVSVPNSGFENARFRILVYDADDNVIGRKMVNSRWLDMPVSLLNIDVAIDMMRFIVSDDQLERLERGSASEKERKFREYWDQRDPTPDTEFNELMTEYYERIDYAYRNFSSPQRPGFESDQGQAYILYGQPDNIERRLPADQPTREIWEYPNRTLIFEATSGFGDFVLISEQQAQ